MTTWRDRPPGAYTPREAAALERVVNHVLAADTALSEAVAVVAVDPVVLRGVGEVGTVQDLAALMRSPLWAAWMRDYEYCRSVAAAVKGLESVSAVVRAGVIENIRTTLSGVSLTEQAVRAREARRQRVRGDDLFTEDECNADMHRFRSGSAGPAIPRGRQEPSYEDALGEPRPR